MTCPDANEVARFLEGDIEPAGMVAFEDHVGDCVDCRVLVTELGSAIEVDAATESADGAWELRSGAEVVDRGTQIDRYVVLDVIGAGAMGVVYRAYDPELDRDVALKLVRVLAEQSGGEHGRARLLREARAMAKFAHPNIVAVYDASVFETYVFVAMELVEGVDLAAYLASTKRPWQATTALFVAAGRGLAAAHAAGIVHRDFKPSNVLVGNDGRVRVTDFGLAVHASDAESAQVAVGSSRVSRDGTLIGTPAYMSPEVRAGKPADERSDQYSFALALCEALTGEREPTAQVPAPVRSVIARGLAALPANRFPSTTALVDALDRAVTARPKILLPLIGVGLVSSVAIAGYVLVANTETDRVSCATPTDRLTGVWDPERKQMIRSAFERSKHPGAAQQWAEVEATLDRHVATWLASHIDACEDTHVRGESAELLDRRMTCLHGERARLSAVTEMFASADRAVVARASTRAADLASHLPRCNDVTALRDAAPLPVPGMRWRADVATTMLTRVETVSLRGNFSAAIVGAKHVIAEAIATGDLRLQADATRSLGETQWRAGHYTDAIQNLYAAIDVAKRAHALDLEAGALLDLVAVLFEEGRYAEALQVARLGESAVRASGDEERLAKLLGNRAAVHYTKGDHAAAKADYELALAVFERIHGTNHRNVGQTLLNLAMVTAESDPGASLPVYERARNVLEAALAPRHPQVALLLANRAIPLANLGRFDEAMHDLALALDIRRAILGADHRDVTTTIVSMGEVELERGGHAAALEHFRAAYAVFDKTLPATHPQRAEVLAGIGRVHVAAKRWQSAREPLEQAIALWETNQLDTGSVAAARFGLARALWQARGDRKRAVALAERARAGFADDPGEQAKVASWLESAR